VHTSWYEYGSQSICKMFVRWHGAQMVFPMWPMLNIGKEVHWDCRRVGQLHDFHIHGSVKYGHESLCWWGPAAICLTLHFWAVVHKVQMPLLGCCVMAGILTQKQCKKFVTHSDQSLLLLKRRLHFKLMNSLALKKFGHGSWQSLKPRTAVLARSGSNLLDWTGLQESEWKSC
jgi:hypothetical protein